MVLTTLNTYVCAYVLMSLIIFLRPVPDYRYKCIYVCRMIVQNEKYVTS